MGNWKTDYIAVKFDPVEIPQMKKGYAKLLAIHNRDSEKAFVDPQMDIIFKFDISAKLYAKNNWVFDDEVKKLVEYYLDGGIADILPTKEKVAKMLFNIAQDTYTTKDKILALKEYADLMGFSSKDKEQQSGNVQNVILLTDNGDNLTWEEKMRKQQFELKEQAEKMLSENE